MHRTSQIFSQACQVPIEALAVALTTAEMPFSQWPNGQAQEVRSCFEHRSPPPHLAKAGQTCPATRRVNGGWKTTLPSLTWAYPEAPNTPTRNSVGPLGVAQVSTIYTPHTKQSNLFRSSSPRNERHELKLQAVQAESSPCTPLRLFQEPLADLGRYHLEVWDRSCMSDTGARADLMSGRMLKPEPLNSSIRRFPASAQSCDSTTSSVCSISCKMRGILPVVVSQRAVAITHFHGPTAERAL